VKDVLVVAGSTAGGKSELAHLIAKSIGGEIIVADSMKVFKGADIGTAKPSKRRQEEVKYHLLDIIGPDKRYDVGTFYRDSCEIIDKLHSEGKVPVVAGGTSFYVARLIEGLAEIPSVEDEILNILEEKNTEELYCELQKADPERASQIHPNMRKRIVRALGVYRQTGKKMSELLKDTNPPGYNFIVMTIVWDRDELYGRINRRVDQMVERGLVNEAEELFEKYGEKAPVFEGVGYKEFISYFKKEAGLEETIEEIKKNTRNYARSQLTWWRNRETIQLSGRKLKL